MLDHKNAFSGKKAPPSYVGKTVTNSVQSQFRVSEETENDISIKRNSREKMRDWNITMNSEDKSKNGSPRNTKLKFDPLVAQEILCSDSDEKKNMVSKFEEQIVQRENVVELKQDVTGAFDQILQEMDYMANEQKEQNHHEGSPYSCESVDPNPRLEAGSSKMVNEAYMPVST